MTLKQIMNQADRYNKAAAALGLKPCKAVLDVRDTDNIGSRSEILSAAYLENIIREEWIDEVADAVLEYDGYQPGVSSAIVARIPDPAIKYGRAEIMWVSLEVFQD